MAAAPEPGKDFIRSAVDNDIANNNLLPQDIRTRFPPEPNGYLHIGHAKSICLNFTLAQEYGGSCSIRLDDTNPSKESEEYTRQIEEDIRWLGFSYNSPTYASDNFEQLYEWAVFLIEHGKAYVDDLSAEEIREYRGTPTEAGKNSPYRERPAAENLTLFQQMRAGEFPEGSRVLRAKIDMAHSNITMRDPVLYRIRYVKHQRVADAWCVYPTYDFAHGQCDAIEGITHSLCTLEFINHRPLYDWFIENLPVPCKPRQIEFARLSLTHTVMSKRKLLQLIEKGYVSAWNDARMPTISGLRRRGFTSSAIKDFCSRVGLSRTNAVVDYALLEFCLREELNKTARRFMAVIDPVILRIVNLPADHLEYFQSSDASTGSAVMNTRGTVSDRALAFTSTLYVERDDYLDDAPRKWFRLAPGKEVRLKYAYYITCVDTVRDEDGKLLEIRCTVDKDSRGGGTADGRKVKGTLHWLSASHAVPAEFRLYDRLFIAEAPDTLDDERMLEAVNPQSCTVSQGFIEPSAAQLSADETVQFLRMGYFCLDKQDSTKKKPVFNRAATLRDSWQRIVRNQREDS